MSTHYREEVFNVLLAQLLQERGIVSAPESITKEGLKPGRKIPDVLLSFRGLRVMVEGKVADKPSAGDDALWSARNRVEQGIAHVGVAVVYPSELRQKQFAELKAALLNCILRIAIVTESQDTGYVEGDVDYLKSALDHAFEHLVEEDVVRKAVDILDRGIDGFAGSLVGKVGVINRMAQSLGIRELPERNRPQDDVLTDDEEAD